MRGAILEHNPNSPGHSRFFSQEIQYIYTPLIVDTMGGSRLENGEPFKRDGGAGYFFFVLLGDRGSAPVSKSIPAPSEVGETLMNNSARASFHRFAPISTEERLE